MPELVRITDVAPRDGLQNESRIVPTPDKARLVELLIAGGVDEVEVSSFVSPQWIPQLADAAELFARIAEFDTSSVCISALVPNERGMRAALAVNESAGRRLIDKVSVFTAASEAFTRRNTNATIAQTLERFRPVIALAHRNAITVRGYVSCAIACPFAGPVAPAETISVGRRLLALGVDELDLADTIGAATPETTSDLLIEFRAALGEQTLAATAIHLHDTFGRAAACIRVALDAGVRAFDGAAGGLGGCPYASTPERRAPGNIATRALVQAIHDHGFATQVSDAALQVAQAFAESLPAA